MFERFKMWIRGYSNERPRKSHDLDVSAHRYEVASDRVLHELDDIKISAQRRAVHPLDELVSRIVGEDASITRHRKQD